MARKTLLNESEMQRLAEMYGMDPGARDEEEEVEMDLAAEEEPMDEPDVDMGADVGMKKVDIGEFFSALETALEDTLGQEVDIEGDDMEADKGGDDEAADMEKMDAPEAEPMGDVEVDMEMSDDNEEDLMEARVNRIAARVARRLVAENKKAANIDALTERIFNRLANK
jgi:hypothetical protein